MVDERAHGARSTVGVVVNVYERTYRSVLRPGFMPWLETQNCRVFDEKVILINNVDDRQDARRRAEELLAAGEISRYEWVDAWRPAAMRHYGLARRHLRRLPHLVDFGLVMPLVVETDWLVGWDAETRLVEPVDWVAQGLRLLTSDPQVLHVSLNWPRYSDHDPVLEKEMIRRVGDVAYSYGFSDHVFLINRSELLAARLRSFAPAAVVRHAPHPYTFEYRMESYQRAVRRYRATLTTVSYETHYPEVPLLSRIGRGSRWDDLRIRALWQFGWTVLDRLPESLGPRFKRYPLS